MSERYGATEAEWAHFDFILGLTEDLLPVVSNPKAVPAPTSKLKQPGKVPSKYNGYGPGVFTGIAAWTSKRAEQTEVDKWSLVRDYGICIQTRRVRAIDVDVEDPALAAEIRMELEEWWVDQTTDIPMPRRTRSNSPKFLVPVIFEGELPKRILRTRAGIIELLGNGQQFVACGTHTSGVRYEWTPDLPGDLPNVGLNALDDLWSRLEKRFATEASKELSAPSKATKLAEAAKNDAVAVALADKGLILGSSRDGRIDIVCPFEEEHTSDSAESSTSYYPANTGGYAQGHFHCLHAHCADRTDHDFLTRLGLAPDPADDFEDISQEPTISPLSASQNAERFKVLDFDAFLAGRPVGWLVKGVLPHAEVGVIYGAPGTGKSFVMLDISASIARGIEWRGNRVRKGRVVYVVSEGRAGFRNRLKAYLHANELPRIPDFGIIANAPNLLKPQDVVDLLAQIEAFGPVDMIVIDTLAQSMPGGNENAGEDVGLVIKHCLRLREKTGAMVVLVHHSGKDEDRGARGWSGLKGAMDVELEVTRDDDARAIRVSKMKDGQDGHAYGFKLNIVQVDLDEDGDPVTSCVLEHTEDISAVRVQSKKLNPRATVQAKALSKFNELVGLDPAAGVQSGKLLQAVVEDMVYIEAPGKRDGRQSTADRALTALVDGGILVLKNGFFYLPKGDNDVK